MLLTLTSNFDNILLYAKDGKRYLTYMHTNEQAAALTGHTRRLILLRMGNPHTGSGTFGIFSFQWLHQVRTSLGCLDLPSSIFQVFELGREFEGYKTRLSDYKAI
jgi:hypothetical protein